MPVIAIWMLGTFILNVEFSLYFLYGIYYLWFNFLKKILKNKEVRWGLIREYNFKIECFDAQTFLTLDIFCGRNKINEIRFVFSQCPYVLNTHYHNS